MNHLEDIDKRLDDILAQLETDFYSYFSGNWDSSTPNDPQLEAHNKLTKLINLLLAEVIDEVLPKEKNTKQFNITEHDTSIERGQALGRIYGWNACIAEIKARAKDMLGEK